RDEILAMKPGRELDALVADKVMGYTTHGQFREKNGVRVMIDRYSADIAAAWEVVERLTRRKDVQKPMFADFSLVKKWDTYEAVFIPVGKLGGKPSFGCKTAAEAICKAALLAVMEE